MTIRRTVYPFSFAIFLLISILAAISFPRIIDFSKLSSLFKTVACTLTPSPKTMSTAASNFSSSKLPVFFLSHGGPTFMYNNDFGGNKGAFDKIVEIGQEIKKNIKPNFIITISGHWESDSSNLIEISIPDVSETSAIDEDADPKLTKFNLKQGISKIGRDFQKWVPEENSLIYDFFGFDEQLYNERFHTKGSIKLAEEIRQQIAQSTDLSAKLTKRGLDHGVWVVLKPAFQNGKLELDSNKWDIDENIPIVQVSLAHTNDWSVNYDLGKALSKFRNQGGLIICSGTSVHNLREMSVALQSGEKCLPYVPQFNKKLSEMLTQHSGDDALQQFNKFSENERSLLLKAHPTLEHIMPIIVAAGAGYEAKAKELFTDGTLSLGWNIYRWD